MENAKQANPKWDDNRTQFARLLSEIRATGLYKEQYDDLQNAMNLSMAEIDELLERAEVAWQFIKEEQ